MLKMIIRMDDNKINDEKKYRLDGVYRTIDNAFAKMGLPRMEDIEIDNSMLFADKTKLI